MIPLGQLNPWRSISIIGFVLPALAHTAKAQEGPGYWGAKTLSMPEVFKRIRFHPLQPKPVLKLQFEKASLGWLKEDSGFRGVPSRQMLCLFYTLKTPDARIAILQAPSFGKAKRWGNLYQAVSQGYFFNGIKVGTYLQFGTLDKTDFLIVLSQPNASDKQLQEMAENIADNLEFSSKIASK